MALVAAQGSIMLEANAAASFKRVNVRCGGGLRITGPYGGHRSEADQAYLRTGYERRMAGWKGYDHFNYAAKPRQSNHEGRAPEWEGFAVDISNYRQYPGLHAAMVAEGWERDPVELWHYNWRGKRTQVVGVAGNVITITPPKPRRLAMPIGYVKRIGTPPNETIYAVDLSTPGAPLRPIGWAEYRAGLGAGIELATIAVLNGAHPFDGLVRERGVIMTDKFLRPIPHAAKPDPGAGYDLIDWRGLAVSRPQG